MPTYVDVSRWHIDQQKQDYDENCRENITQRQHEHNFFVIQKDTEYMGIWSHVHTAAIRMRGHTGTMHRNQVLLYGDTAEYSFHLKVYEVSSIVTKLSISK